MKTDVDYEQVALQLQEENGELREQLDQMHDIAQENLRLQALLKITEMPRPELGEPERVNPFPGQMVGVVDFTYVDYGGEEYLDLYATLEDAAFAEKDAGGANLVVSRTVGDDVQHKIVLDIDHPVKVLPSSTPGHYHLFIDKAMTWRQYQHVLQALALTGVVEPGYVDASIARGFTAVRLPWMKKEQA